MVKQFLKKRSKRISTKTRTKIEKKVRDHNKKSRRDAKKNSNKLLAKNKDPGVPNSCPFKEQVLKEAEDHKKRLEDERQRHKDKTKKEREKMFAKKRNLEGLMKDAQRRGDEFNKKVSPGDGDKTYSSKQSVETSLKAYYKEFRKVVDAADVVIQVLDARDPLGSRCPQVEQAVLSAGADKRLVLLLNKIDLVPRDNVEKWLKYLRNEFPTIAFKACTQTQSDNLSQLRVPVAQANDDLLKSSRCIGADLLMKLLGNYCRKQDIRSSITVGVVGFPNTGKSSIINSLKRSKACSVGATPGVTKNMQEVQLDKHVKLLDSPGIVMATGNTDASVILRNCVKVETVEDPVVPVGAILRRCNKQQMMMHYNLPDFANVNEFLSLLAKRSGRLRKGGIPDVNKAARTVLQDWNHGKITYYTHPPETHEMPTHVSAEFVAQMSKEFDIDALLQEEQKTLKDLKLSSENDVVIESSGPTAGSIDDTETEMERDGEDEGSDSSDEEEEDAMEEEETEESKSELSKTTVTLKGGRSRASSTSTSEVTRKPAAKGLPGNMQLNSARKKDFKKMKKQRRRNDVVAGQLSEALEGALVGMGGTKEDDHDSDNYDFDNDLKM